MTQEIEVLNGADTYDVLELPGQLPGTLGLIKLCRRFAEKELDAEGKPYDLDRELWTVIKNTIDFAQSGNMRAVEIVLKQFFAPPSQELVKVNIAQVQAGGGVQTSSSSASPGTEGPAPPVEMDFSTYLSKLTKVAEDLGITGGASSNGHTNGTVETGDGLDEFR